ncbi:Uncharacterised protein [Nocardia africana]|uniref:Uncharacterized protein n=1 Tax=Nocardia africana TaxID=134964 RepID=A0A378WYN1_9NOCA|nr:Uncharacterised protein [Nocardia africana]
MLVPPRVFAPLLLGGSGLAQGGDREAGGGEHSDRRFQRVQRLDRRGGGTSPRDASSSSPAARTGAERARIRRIAVWDRTIRAEGGWPPPDRRCRRATAARPRRHAGIARGPDRVPDGSSRPPRMRHRGEIFTHDANPELGVGRIRVRDGLVSQHIHSPLRSGRVGIRYRVFTVTAPAAGPCGRVIRRGSRIPVGAGHFRAPAAPGPAGTAGTRRSSAKHRPGPAVSTDSCRARRRTDRSDTGR